MGFSEEILMFLVIHTEKQKSLMSVSFITVSVKKNAALHIMDVNINTFYINVV